jgi:hypothetical protein
VFSGTVPGCGLGRPLGWGCDEDVKGLTGAAAGVGPDVGACLRCRLPGCWLGRLLGLGCDEDVKGLSDAAVDVGPDVGTVELGALENCSTPE